MSFPILVDHDHSRLFGMVLDDGTVKVKAGMELTREQIYDTFGNVGIQITNMVKKDNMFFVTAFKITEFSIDTKFDFKKNYKPYGGEND